MNPSEPIPASDFDYPLPPERIAQTPAEPRDASRLLVLQRETGEVEHAVFRDITRWLRQGDVLVLNNTRVIPARLFGTKRGAAESQGQAGARIEILLLEDRGEKVWRVLANRARRLKVGSVVGFDAGESATVLEQYPDGQFDMRFAFPGSWEEFLTRRGKIPLPPYIEPERPGRDDVHRYQTVYARLAGSAAAPTAGLHFTPELLEACRERGIGTAEVTLHVGLDTFRPVMVEDLREHVIHSEHYEVSGEAAAVLNGARERGGRIVAVGTTSTRTLETVADAAGRIRAGSGKTELFILPGHKFRGVDVMVTNFHLPKSTLLAMVSAFCGWENLRRAYEVAVQEEYRFYSYGDAMLIF